MVNEGRLAPVVDVVQALRDEAVGAGDSAKRGGSSSGGRGGGGGEGAPKGGGKRKAARKDVSQAHYRTCVSTRKYFVCIFVYISVFFVYLIVLRLIL